VERTIGFVGQCQKEKDRYQKLEMLAGGIT